MARTTKFISKRTDAELVAFFEACARIVGASGITILASGQDRQWTLPIGTVGGETDWIRESSLRTITLIMVGADRFNISVDRRPETHKENGIDLSVLDVLIVNAEPNHSVTSKPALDNEQVNNLNLLIDETFGNDINLSAYAYKDPKTFQAVIKSHQQIIERLQTMTLEVGEQTAQARKELDAEYIELKKQLADQNAAERLELQKANDTERTLLAERADELAERARALDDRNNTHVRRELFEKTRRLIADRFKKLDLTPETKRARIPIHIGVAATAVILGFLIYYFTSEALVITARADSTITERVLTIAKSATASLGFLGVISWYLRWMNRWFERLADTEFQLKQFELDITRAQWVVETAFEWKMSQQTPIPDHLLESVSRNLFNDKAKDDGADMHPADYLASALIGKASNVKLAVPGAEIELGPKALKGTSA